MRFLIFILSFLIGPTAWGQEWNIYMEDDAVRIEYASLNIFTDSTYGEKVLFRYSNKTNEALMLKFVRKVRFVDNTLQKRKRLKYKILLEPNQTVGAKLKDPITEESPFQLFLGWNSDSWYVVSFRIDKVNHYRQ